MPSLLKVLIIIAGMLFAIIGVLITNQFLTVVGGILVIVPFVQKSIDDLFGKRWFEALFNCLAILLFILVCIWALNPDIEKESISPNRPGLWFFIVGAGSIQLLWMLLIRSKND